MNKNYDEIMKIIFGIAVIVVALAFILFIVEIIQYQLILNEFKQSADGIRDEIMYFS